ncbi:MAG: 6-phosphofructokinase [Omnitrophica bacterium RBG_13_46_9]|nr:MAG: 6-phosphofructokinase [Omnitrophica bacterium RBG_13_46_9]
MKRIGILTSGGDAPGMNAAIRSVTRCAIHSGMEVKGILRGYQGLINNEVIDMDARSVSNILGRGGTILKTARSEEFMTEDGRKKAFETVEKNGLDDIVVIGGNGSFQGAHIFWKEFKVRTIGIPATIDNDISGSDYSIGAYTAVNTALDAIDKIRDTVTSMERIYVIEVMGREEPFIAIRVGLAGGAEDVLFPYNEYNIEDMCEDIILGRKIGKISWIIVVSEGVASAPSVADIIRKRTNFSVRPIVLGHIQRGGAPEAFDRILASRLGFNAVEALLEGHTDAMVGIVSEELKITPYEEAIKKDCKKRLLNEKLYKITKVLAT